MKKYKGLIGIILSFILTYIFWSFVQSGTTASNFRQYSQLIASLALITFAWVFYISTRHRYVDTIFNGLDNSYIYHKYLSILAIIFIWVHNFTLKMGSFSGGRPSGIKAPGEGFKPSSKLAEGASSGLFNIPIPGKLLASWSLYIFTALVIIFIISYKLEYERWKLVHKLIIIPYIFGVVHYYLNAEYDVFALSAYSIWMSLMNLIGIISAIYSIFLYERFAFKYHYKVSNIKEVAKNMLEITGISSTNGMKYKPGQFAFMKILGKNKNFPSHPFTISQAPKSCEIQLTIKALGDHTGKLKNNLVQGDIIALSGPFGKFDYRLGEKRQIWIAGGIGITPFRSFWQEEIPPDYTIDFFYAYNNEEEGAYVEELKTLKSIDNFRIHLFDSSKSGFLKVEDFEKYIKKSEHHDVYFCGPKGMRIKLKKDFKKGMFKIGKFHYEHFEFK